MLEMFKRTKASIGLDIGTHSIKLVELRHAHKGVLLTNFAVKELPLEATGEKRSADLTAEKVKEFFLEEKIKARKVTIVVSGSQVAMRRISLPPMPKKELKEAVRWEARKFISFPIEDAIVDFQLLCEIVEEGVKKLDLIVAVAEGEFIENQLAIVKEADLEAVGIGTTPHALLHCMQMIPETSEGVIALIDIGATKSSINIVKDNRLQFTREIVTAGNSLTEAVKEAATLADAALDFAQAEEIKKEYAIPKEQDVEGAIADVPMQKISFVMRPVLERLLTEIKRSFEFHARQFKEENVERIFICGGGARLKGLREYLAEQLDTEIELLTPFENMSPTLAIATGLALGRAKEINLLPDKYRLASKVLLQKCSSVALACLVFVVLLGMYFNMDAARTRYGKDLTLKEARLADLQSVNIRLLQLEEIKNRLDQEKALFPKGALDQPPWGEIFNEISHIVPKKTTLTGLSFQTRGAGKELRLEGVSFGGDAEVLGSMVEIMEVLEQSSLFSGVRLSSSEGNSEYSEPGTSFEIMCRIVNTE